MENKMDAWMCMDVCEYTSAECIYSMHFIPIVYALNYRIYKISLHSFWYHLLLVMLFMSAIIKKAALFIVPILELVKLVGLGQY